MPFSPRGKWYYLFLFESFNKYFLFSNDETDEFEAIKFFKEIKKLYGLLGALYQILVLDDLHQVLPQNLLVALVLPCCEALGYPRPCFLSNHIFKS